MQPGFLHRYFMSNGEKRLHKWFHYFDIYERHLQRFCGQSPKVLEVGVHGGGSVHMWRDYFGPGAKIVGLDINPNCAQHAAENIEIFIGSQDDDAILDEIHAKYGDFDVILDDGSHIMKHMIHTFARMYDRVTPRGVYMVEDAHTSYNKRYDGGRGRKGTFMEFVKDRIDDLHAARDRAPPESIAFAAATDSINVYDGVVVFERRPQGHRQAPVTQTMLNKPPKPVRRAAAGAGADEGAEPAGEQSDGE